MLLRNQEGKLLILKRSEEKYGKLSGNWDIVGGRIDPGTSLLENLRREVMEETKLEITSEPRLIAAQDIIPNDDRHIVRLTYVAHTVGEPALDEEHTELKWVSLSDLSREGDIDSYASKLVQDGTLHEGGWS